MSEANGGTETSAPELPAGIYSQYVGDSGTTEEDSTPEETPAAEPASKEAETPKTDGKATETNWEERYRNANEALGRQGRELGETVKSLKAEIEQLKKQQRPEADPITQDPELAALDPKQRNLLLRGGDVALKRLLQDAGMSVNDLPQIKQTLTMLVEQQTQDAIAREVGELKQEFGEAEFNRYIPQMQQIAQRHPDLSPREVYDLATAADHRKASGNKVKALEAERKQRAAAADFGKERPNPKDDDTLSGDALKKLSRKQTGSGPSSLFKAILKEQIRKSGG